MRINFGKYAPDMQFYAKIRNKSIKLEAKNLIFKRLDCSKFNADSEYVIKNGFFCYLAANFIDLLLM